MALVFEGFTRCPICEKAISAGDSIVATTAFMEHSAHPLWWFNDAAMHATCFAAWPERDAFIALHHTHYAKHFRGMRFMLPAGEIVDQNP